MAQPLTRPPRHHFFGFHDLSPWDETGRFVLAHETDFIDRPPVAEDIARICVIDTYKNNELRVVAETRAWNFHQGARLQWLPGEASKIIYNDRRKDEHGWDGFVSVILNIETGEEKVLSYPIYAISPDGSFGLGLDFLMLGARGGYGYTLVGEKTNPNLPPPDPNDPFWCEKNSGVVRVNLETGENNLMIKTYDIATEGRNPSPAEHHALTHITFNPSGSRVCVMDKYRLPDGGFRQRLVTMSPDGKDLYVLPGHVTHYDWKNDGEILGYGKFSPYVMALRGKGFFRNPLFKPLLGIVRKMRGGLKQKIAGQSYLLFKDKSQDVERIAVGTMTEDGHPQFSPDRRWVITDTYADKNHERTLMLWNWKEKKRMDIGTFYSLPKEDGGKITLPNGKSEYWDISKMRADLHPRWNRDGTKVCIDSVHEGTRQIYEIDVGSLVN